LVGEEAEHLSLLFAVDEAVLVLHGDELRPAV
jgi:UDP-2,3-diacylglucosamine pyrophosphatase LpxH